MQKQRVLIAFGVAWLTALILSWMVYKKTTAPVKREVAQVVAAAKDIPVGKLVEAADLKLVTLDRKDSPSGSYSKIADVEGRAVVSQLVSGEFVLDGKLTEKGGGESLTALIEKGMRAVSVQVNEISGVSGFIQPGTRVDVIFTRIFQSGDAKTTTILQNAKVLAFGKQLQPDTKVKVDAREAAKVNVATLLVTGEQAEMLTLAMQRGKIQLVLRNPLDNEIEEDREPIESADLGIPEPVKPAPPRPVQKTDDKPKPRPVTGGGVEQRIGAADPNSFVVHVYRGTKVSENVFEK